MAKSGTKSGSLKERFGIRSVGLTVLGVAIFALAVAVSQYREPIAGYAEVGTSYAARVACSCRFVAGRSMEDCAKDKLGGMELVSLSDDEEAKSVTATFPLVTSNTAAFREGYGCVLEEWEG